MTRFSLNLLAKLLAALLLLIVIRALSEVFRLEYQRGEAMTYAEGRPFIVGAIAAALSLAAALLAVSLGRSRLAVVVACFAIAGLFIYRLYFFPPAVETPVPPLIISSPPA